MKVFLDKLNVGDYVKVQIGGSCGRTRVQRISKVTATQIVFGTDPLWRGNKPSRFNRDSGCERGRDYYYADRITQDVVTPKEIEEYESRLASNKAFADRLDALNEICHQFREQILGKFQGVTPDKIKLDFSMNKEADTWSLTLENLTQDEMRAAASDERKGT